MNAETKLMTEIRAAVNLIPGVRLVRNNVGMGVGWGELQAWLRNGRPGNVHPILFGLGKGSPDLIGVIHGHPFGLEVKTSTGRERREQKLWKRWAKKFGITVATVRSVAQALAVVRMAEHAWRSCPLEALNVEDD